jgi:hypothetical protein
LRCRGFVIRQKPEGYFFFFAAFFAAGFFAAAFFFAAMIFNPLCRLNATIILEAVMKVERIASSDSRASRFGIRSTRRARFFLRR